MGSSSGSRPAGRLEGKVAIVTGGGSGIGEASCRLFAAHGATVVVADVDDAGAERVADEIVAAGGTATAARVDVTSEADTQRMADAAAEHGPVDVLYANAGIPGSGRAGDLTYEQWQRVIDVNLTGVWLSARAVLPQMLDHGGGSIINQASVGGLIGVGGIAAYAAAKAGVIGLTRQMAVDYGPQGVRVNAICPGTVPTPLVRRTYEEGGGFASSVEEPLDFEALIERTRSRYPLGRVGTVEDIAAMALHLASDESAWTTGTAIAVDGGMTAW